MITQLGVFSVLALSLSVVVGYSGFLSLAHAAYFAVGCYTYALITIWGGDFTVAITVSLILGGILSLALSLPAWRLRGDFFAVSSLAVQAVIFGIIYNWYSGEEQSYGTLSNLTNGPLGISGLPSPQILTYSLDGDFGRMLLSLCVAVVLIAITRRLLYSPWGRLLRAVRDDELAARSLGKPIRLIRVQTFALSCSMAAAAGVTYASYLGFLDPMQGRVDLSIDILCMVLIGGANTIRGPILGAALLVLAPEFLRFLPMSDHIAADVRRLLYGSTLVGVMHYRPQGLFGESEV